jgi:F420-0:gamma-glutamyl ligase
LALEIDDNMQKKLCIDTLETAVKMYPELAKNHAICHSDHGSQYTSGGIDPKNLGYRGILS